VGAEAQVRGAQVGEAQVGAGAVTLETEAEAQLKQDAQEEAGVQCGAREHKPWRARKQVH
jgi:hypothetical protein